ncbi:MAG: hypothetical protein WCG81_01660 [Candidatus Angelobacter sp.]
MIARLLALVVFSLVSTSWTDVSKSPFSIAVVPTQSFDHGGTVTMAHDKAGEFYVVLTNVSAKSQEVFEAWNSWGYQTVSFEFTLSNGKKIVVSRRQHDFTRNGATTFMIQPGEHQVFAIRLDQWWEAKPALRKINEMPIKLKAIYQVLLTPEATKAGVWIGRTESHDYNLSLRQW